MNRIKTARLQLGMTQRRLADAVGISKSTMSLYEIGTSEPSIATFKKLAHVLKTTPAYLMELDEPAAIQNAPQPKLKGAKRVLVDLSKHQVTIVGKFTFAAVFIDSIPYQGVVTIKYEVTQAFGNGSALLELLVQEDEFWLSSIRVRQLMEESEKLLQGQ